MIGGVLIPAILLASAPLADDEPPTAPPSSVSSTAASEPQGTTPVMPVVVGTSGEPRQAPAAVPGPASQTTAANSTPEASDIVVTARPRSVRGDPLQQVNAQSFAVTQAVDGAIVGPVSLAYENALPAPVRSGLRNFLNNLHEPVVALNFLLQLKPGKAAETAGRFAINSTVGAVGVLDIAKRRPFNLARRPNGFADTFGYYGIAPGPFLFLPLIGATTVRDLIGGTLDGSVLPLAIGRPFNRAIYTIPTGVVRGLDRRAEFDEKLQTLRESADPYAAARVFYLQRRQAEIDRLRGRHDRAVPPASPIPDPAAVPSVLPAPDVAAPAVVPPPSA